MLAQHSSRTNEHFTPPGLADLVCETFGHDIELDPASCKDANKLVRAQRIYTVEDDGRSLPWDARTVYNNPPGGEAKTAEGETVSQAALWWATMATRHEADEFEQAAFLCFNLELLRHAQAWPVRQPLEYTVCVFRHRISYYQRNRDGVLVPRNDPTHPSALVYLGPNNDRFRKIFEREGPFAGRVFIAR